jgi:Ser/Thr protein kinase RdoA (MazF antagonist)
LAECRHCERKVFVKKLKASDQSDAFTRAATEFLAASQLHQSFPIDSETGVTRPLALRGSTLIFEPLEGRSLAAILRAGPSSSRRAAAAKAGMCFARLHTAGTTGFDVIDLETKYLSLLTHCGRDAEEIPLMRSALGHLREELPKFSGCRYELVRLHGDAKPDNFVLADCRMVAVDADWMLQNVGEMDLAQFLVQLPISLANPFGRLDAELSEDLEHEFIEGYQRCRKLDVEVLAWLKTYFFISFWRSGRNRSILFRLRFHHLFQQRLHALTQRSRRAV